MATTILYSSEYITVEYQAENGLIYHTVRQPIGDHPQMLKDALNMGTNALREHKICKWLSDDRKNGPLPQEIVEWGVTDWNNRTIEVGWKYWANIVPDDLKSAGTLIPIIHKLSTLGLQMRLFTNVEDALAWLASV